tara:strand:+ start:2239 stop:3552 length:1314 start_codon:yes stop_codon:yes gene_type:complete
MTKNTFSTIIEILSLEQIDILINTYFSKLERLLQLLVALTVLVIVFAFTLRRKDGKRIVIPYVIMALLYCLRLVTLVPKINPEAIPDKQLSKDLEQIKKRTGDYRTAYGATANSLEKVVNQTSLALENVDPDLIENHTILVERTDQTFIVIQNIKQQIRDIFDYIDNLVDDAENQLQQLKEKKRSKKPIQKLKRNSGKLVLSSPSSTSMVTVVDDNSLKYSAIKKSTLVATERVLEKIQMELKLIEYELNDIILLYNNDLPKNEKLTKDFIDRTIKKLKQRNTRIDSIQAEIFKYLEKPLLYATDNLDESTEKLIISVLNADGSVIETLTNEVIGKLPTSLGNLGKQYRVSLNSNIKAFPLISSFAVDGIIAIDKKMLLALLFAINGGMLFSDSEQQKSIQVQQVSQQQYKQYKKKQQQQRKRNKNKLSDINNLLGM